MANITIDKKQLKKLVNVMLVLGLVLLVLLVWSWWHYVRSNPERTFYAALENSLSSRSVTKRVSQDSLGQKLNQQVELTFGPEHVAHGRTKMVQSGEADTTVETETISTPQEDFVRYVAIDTDQKNDSGEVLDFSELLNVWGKTSQLGDEAVLGELYGESVLGVVPFADLSADQRGAIMDFIREKNVYQFDSNKVKRSLENGRPVYVYEVTISPESYVGMLKLFARALGITQLESIDPAEYRESQALQVEFTIDVWSRQLVQIEFEGGARTEQLSGHGVIYDATLPVKTIPIEDLQQRLQQVQ